MISSLQECLEQRVMELELALEQEHKANHKDRMAITKLQRQLARVSTKLF